MRIVTPIVVWSLLAASVAVAQQADAPRPIPYVSDIHIDGPASQWKAVKPIGNWNDKANIVFGDNNWTGPADLGGTAWVGWDQQNLYITADITDDHVSQGGAGENIWRGDHVMVLMNVHPERDVAPSRFQYNGQFMLGLSPGSLQSGGDPLSNLPPEVYIWQPQYVGNSGIAVDAKKTDAGYTISAAIPWTFLGVQPHNGMRIALDIAPSDCDTSEMQQQSLASLLTSKWSISTDRLLDAVLQGGEGVASASGPSIELSSKEIQVSQKTPQEFTFTLPQQTDGLAPVLSMKARFVTKALGGLTHGMVVKVNGKELGPQQNINRPRQAHFADGRAFSLFAANAWVLIYSPDYSAIHTQTQSNYYIKPGPFNAYEFDFNVSEMLVPGKNTVTIENRADSRHTVTLAFENLAVKWVSPKMAERPAETVKVRPAVTVRPPAPLAPPAHADFTRTGALSFQAAGKTWVVDSQYSLPDGKWASLAGQRNESWKKINVSSAQVDASTDQFSLVRTIRVLDQCIEIHEKITNLTDQKQPVMVRHQLSLPKAELAALTMNGRPMPLKRGVSSSADNPTLLLQTTQGGGLALLPYDGVFRLHHQAFYLNDSAGLADSNLVLAPHSTYEQVWQVYSVPSGDYWDLVNAVRQQWDNNFKIDGPFAFVDPRSIPGRNLQGDYTVEQMRQWVDRRNVKLPSVSSYDPVDNGALQGLANRLEGKYLEKVTHFVDVIHQAAPGVPVLRYYHCFITGTPYDKEASQADALRDASGQQVFYSNNKHWPIFVPTDTNQYGRQMTQLAKDLVQKLNLQGLYWDEQQDSYKQYDYGDIWDGVSGDIDRKTHKLIRTKALVTLISAKFRYNLMDWFKENNLIVICNGQPTTPEDARYKIHRFVETGSVTNIYGANLFSPIGLGDHLTEKTSADVIRQQIDFLNYGGLYDYYSSSVDVQNPGLCRWMYPITPVALGPGYVMGQEKIVTNRSGKYSWGGKTLPEVEVHEIDRTGKEVKVDWKKITADGIEWVQLTLPEGHGAVIVRK